MWPVDVISIRTMEEGFHSSDFHKTKISKLQILVCIVSCMSTGNRDV